MVDLLVNKLVTDLKKLVDDAAAKGTEREPGIDGKQGIGPTEKYLIQGKLAELTGVINLDSHVDKTEFDALKRATKLLNDAYNRPDVAKGPERERDFLRTGADKLGQMQLAALGRWAAQADARVHQGLPLPAMAVLLDGGLGASEELRLEKIVPGAGQRPTAKEVERAIQQWTNLIGHPAADPWQKAFARVKRAGLYFVLDSPLIRADAPEARAKGFADLGKALEQVRTAPKSAEELREWKHFERWKALALLVQGTVIGGLARDGIISRDEVEFLDGLDPPSMGQQLKALVHLQIHVADSQAAQKARVWMERLSHIGELAKTNGSEAAVQLQALVAELKSVALDEKTGVLAGTEARPEAFAAAEIHARIAIASGTVGKLRSMLGETSAFDAPFLRTAEAILASGDLALVGESLIPAVAAERAKEAGDLAAATKIAREHLRIFEESSRSKDVPFGPAAHVSVGLRACAYLQEIGAAIGGETVESVADTFVRQVRSVLKTHPERKAAYWFSLQLQGTVLEGAFPAALQEFFDEIAPKGFAAAPRDFDA